ncbi:MAG: hypothetical protein QXP36_02015, partial [Conexivisphaerales archaeon]
MGEKYVYDNFQSRIRNWNGEKSMDTYNVEDAFEKLIADINGGEPKEEEKYLQFLKEAVGVATDTVEAGYSDNLEKGNDSINISEEELIRAEKALTEALMELEDAGGNTSAALGDGHEYESFGEDSDDKDDQEKTLESILFEAEKDSDKDTKEKNSNNEDENDEDSDE